MTSLGWAGGRGRVYKIHQRRLSVNRVVDYVNLTICACNTQRVGMIPGYRRVVTLPCQASYRQSFCNYPPAKISVQILGCPDIDPFVN